MSKKNNIILCLIIGFYVILLMIFGFSDNQMKNGIINDYNRQCHRILREAVSDSAGSGNPEGLLLAELKEIVDPSASEYAFLAKNQKLLFVRDDMTTVMFEDQKVADFISAVNEGTDYQLNTEKLSIGGAVYSVGIYTKESYILGKSGFDVFERRLFLCMLMLIITTLVTIYLLLDRLQRAQTESEELRRKNKMARTYLERVREECAGGSTGDSGKPRTEFRARAENAGTAEPKLQDNYHQYRFNFYLNASHGIYIDGEMGEVHSHTWEICINAVKSENNFVMFSDVENVVEQYLSQYQNKLFNEFKPFDVVNPTLENITSYLLDQLQEIMNSKGWYIFSIEVSETPTRSFVISLL